MAFDGIFRSAYLVHTARNTTTERSLVLKRPRPGMSFTDAVIGPFDRDILERALTRDFEPLRLGPTR